MYDDDLIPEPLGNPPVETPYLTSWRRDGLLVLSLSTIRVENGRWMIRQKDTNRHTVFDSHIIKRKWSKGGGVVESGSCMDLRNVKERNQRKHPTCRPDVLLSTRRPGIPLSRSLDVNPGPRASFFPSLFPPIKRFSIHPLFFQVPRILATLRTGLTPFRGPLLSWRIPFPTYLRGPYDPGPVVPRDPSREHGPRVSGCEDLNVRILVHTRLGHVWFRISRVELQNVTHSGVLEKH